MAAAKQALDKLSKKGRFPIESAIGYGDEDQNEQQINPLGAVVFRTDHPRRSAASYSIRNPDSAQRGVVRSESKSDGLALRNGKCKPRSFHRWGVILAGGDGKRLLSLTRRIAGDDRPKQFCRIVGGQTLLEQTRSRVCDLVPPKQTCVVVTKSHERFYRNCLESPTSSLLVQPWNKGTAPAIAYSLMRLRELDPRAVVAFFPSDHHFADEEKFLTCVDSAFAAAECPPGRVVLLGIVPDSPEVAYVWIEPGAPISFGLGPLFRVSRFWEKPALDLASALMKRGCLWNSFVMVGRVESFLKMIRQVLPDLLHLFESLRPAFCTRLEAPALLELYSGIRSSSFFGRSARRLS